MLIAHVYPASMTHHLVKMLRDNPEVFAACDNISVLVDPEASAFAARGTLPQHVVRVRPRDLTRVIRTLQPSLTIFHSMFFPKAWVAATALAITGARLVWISWGGDLTGGGSGHDLKGRIIRVLKRFTVPRFHRVVCLAGTDLAFLEAHYPKAKGTVIPYYSAAYLPFESAHRGGAAVAAGARVQIGNDASALNDHPRCLRDLAATGAAATVVLPLGYGRFRENYIDETKALASDLFPGRVETYDEMLGAAEFDALIRGCDALLLGSMGQRALYNVYAYLMAGKPVFLPAASELREELNAAGFSVGALENLAAATPEEFIALCAKPTTANRDATKRHLGLDDIRSRWADVIFGTSPDQDGVWEDWRRSEAYERA